MLLKEFLERVLPTDGHKCWVEINRRKKVTQGFVATTEELAAKMLEIDARGSDAYFGCSSYKTPENRTQLNVMAAKAFWLDIDVGENKPYADIDAAISACDELCDRARLPLPGLVRSGGGLHAYWPLDTELEAAAWSRAAARLKLLLQANGFHADPARTADGASILRPPGTKNYKLPHQARSVEILDSDGWESHPTVGFLEQLFACQIPPVSVQPSTVAINSPSETAAVPISAALISNDALVAGISKTFDAAKGVKAGQRGSTQLRYAGELVAKGFSQDDVLAKCMAWNALCEPPQDEKEVRRIVNSAFNMHARKHPPVMPAEQIQQLPPLPFGYQWGPQQQLLAKIKVEGEAQLRIVSPYPVYLAALLRHEQGARTNSYLFRQYNPTDGWHEFCMDSEQINAQNWYAGWFKAGGSVHKGMEKLFLGYVREAEIMLRKEYETLRYNQFGWKEDKSAFLVGDILMRKGQPVRAYGTDKLTPLMRTMALPKEGSLEEWTAAADKFFAPGMEAHGFALLTSFAAPLMTYVAGLGDGGSILSLVSEDSGRGKTPLSEAIASVWGDLDSTVVTGNFTENRRIESIVRHCHLPQVQEEMTLSDPLIAGESIKKFTTGCDRGRLNRNGAAQEVPERYQTVLVSISNTSLYEMVALVDRAASRRILEVDMVRPENEVFSNLGGVTREMMRCRAFAGRRYAQVLTTPGIPEYLKEHLTGLDQNTPGSVIMRYRNLLASEAEHRFIVWLLAVVDVAARLVTHYGLLHFDVERIMHWATTQAYERTNDKTIVHPEGKLQRFLAENIGSCLVVSGPFEKDKGPVVSHIEPRNQMFMRLELKTHKLYISTDALQRWCTRNRESFIKMGKTLSDQGIVMERSRSVTLGAGTMIPSGRCYCWEIDMTHPCMSGMLRDATEAVASVKQA